MNHWETFRIPTPSVIAKATSLYKNIHCYPYFCQNIYLTLGLGFFVRFCFFLVLVRHSYSMRCLCSGCCRSTRLPLKIWRPSSNLRPALCPTDNIPQADIIVRRLGQRWVAQGGEWVRVLSASHNRTHGPPWL